MSANLISEIATAVVAGIASPSGEVVVVSEVECLQQQLKSLELSDLFKVMKATVAEMERKSKAAAKQPRPVTKEKEAKPKKAGSQPKGAVPHQLRENKAWITFTLETAMKTGWESYVMHQSKKNKVTGEKVEEEIVMPCSMEHEGKHVYEGSVTEKKPNGQELTHGHAMSLAAAHWTKKTQTGTHRELYEKFLSNYKDEPVIQKEKPVKKEVVRKTAEEKEQEKEAKALKAAEEKEAKALKVAEEKEAKALAKQKEKDEAAAKKAEAKEEKQKKPSVVVKEPSTPVKAKAVLLPSAPVKAKKAVASVASVAWTCEDDGLLHAFPFKGVEYLRNYANEVWRADEDGSMGEWCGVFLVKEDRIDDSVEEPTFE